MGSFRVGDVVHHVKLETDKVIVGAEKDRYLCVHSEDISQDGQVRAHARVAMHRSDNLRKIGHREDVIAVNLDDLYKTESISRHRSPVAWRGRGVLLNTLFVVLAVFIVWALLTGIDLARHEIEGLFDRTVAEKKKEYRSKIRKEVKQKRQSGKKMSPEIQKLIERYKGR